jgi:TonB family protein
MFLLAVAALGASEPTKVVAPEPIKPEGWIRYVDYPDDALRQGQVGTTWFDVLIDEAGQPFGCKTVSSSEVKALDEVSCRLMMQRARFQPARDQFGAAVPSVFRRSASWTLDGNGRRSAPPVDVLLTVSRLPEGTKPEVLVNVVEDPDGRSEVCSVATSSGSDRLDRIACDLVSKVQMADPLVGPTGTKVRAVRARRVAFRVGDAN